MLAQTEVVETTAAIEQLWTKIGLSEEEKIEGKLQIQNNVLKVFSDFLAKVTEESNHLEKEIEETIQNHVVLLRAVGCSEDEVQPILSQSREGTLRQQYLAISSEYNNSLTKYEKQIGEMERIFSEISTLYDTLGIPKEARGDCSELGSTDYSTKRLNEFQQLKRQLTEEIANRSKKLIEFNSELAKISVELEVDIPDQLISIFTSNILTDDAFALIESTLQEFRAVREERIQKLEIIATKIYHLWKLLSISEEEQKAFLETHSNVGTKSIQEANSELERLIDLRNARLPSLIQKQEAEIQAVSDYLKVPISAKPSGTPLEIFQKNEKTLEHLTILKKNMEPYLELINQREELLKEQDILSAEAAKIAKSNGKIIVDPKKQNKDEQALRRCKNLLPRLEKKLYMMLIEYKTHQNEELMWDGEPYINKLSHIHLSDVEMKKARGSSRKKSIQPRCGLLNYRDDVPIPQRPNKSVHRHSENAKYLANL